MSCTLAAMLPLPLIGGASSAGAESPTTRDIERVVIGTSVQGREMIAERFGTPGGPIILLVGLLHGDEGGASRVIAALRREFLTKGTTADVWVIRSANPDGARARTRGNSRGVDLNRNFPTADWVLTATGRNYSGRRAGSEPETQAIAAFIQERKPALSIWYHQVGPMVDFPGKGDRELLKRYSTVSGYPLIVAPCRGVCAGMATSFHAMTVPGATAFVVELPARVDSKQADINVRATTAVMRLLDLRLRSQ